MVRDTLRLLDDGYVTVTAGYEFKVSRALEELWRNGRTYYELQRALHGKPIRVPRREPDRPAREALAWHAGERFRG